MLPSKKVLTVNPTSKMEETKNNDLEVAQDEEIFEIEDDIETDDDSTQEDEENSTQLQAELKAKEAEIAKLNRLLKKKEKVKVEETSSSVSKEDLERVRLEIKGYDDDQIDFIMSLGGSKALTNPAVKKVADAMREEKKQLEAQATSTSQAKSTRTYSQAEINAMPVAQLEKLIREGKIKTK